MPLPADERALAVVQIEPATRQLFLAEVWPRAALDATTLGQRLDTHLAQHRERRADRLLGPLDFPRTRHHAAHVAHLAPEDFAAGLIGFSNLIDDRVFLLVRAGGRHGG